MAFRMRGRGRPKTKTGMNGLETWYAEILEAERLQGKILYWAYEPIKLRLADRTYYTPDFLRMNLDGEVQFIETKAFWEDDARVKIKVAAQTHPFRFFALTCKCRRKQWSIEKLEEFGG